MKSDERIELCTSLGAGHALFLKRCKNFFIDQKTIKKDTVERECVVPDDSRRTVECLRRRRKSNQIRSTRF
jgi:hypothetical protein